MTVYNNPIVLQRADPWVLKVDGEYWFTASDPEYDKIAIRHASTINDLQKAPETVVWRKHESGVCSKYIWAPELHRVNGAWYIYFAGAVTIISVFFDSLAAYGLSRVDFKGRGILLAVLIATMMIPAMALLIPVYKLLGSMGLVNSYLGIIIPRMADVGGIFLLRQFFISIPKDLDNAARIDGAGEFRIFAQIILPNAVPAILTVGMFNFMGNWNDLLWPLIMTSKPETRTITAGLAMLTGHGSSVTPYGVVMAGALISALPLLIVFFFVQKRFVEGIAMTGMK